MNFFTPSEMHEFFSSCLANGSSGDGMATPLREGDQFKSASECLRKESRHIQVEWERRVRLAIPPSGAQSSPAIINSLGTFISELVLLLEVRGQVQTTSTHRGMSQLHGRDRASFDGYFLPQVLKEFALLRKVVNETLHANGVLAYPVRACVEDAISEVVSLAATEFTDVQQGRSRQALINAEQSNRELEQFAAIAAHDLKAPLATICGFLHLVQDDYAELSVSERQHCLQTMANTASRMQILIDRLLDYARLNTVEPSLSLLSLNKPLLCAVENLNARVKAAGASISFGELPEVFGNEVLLTQVFQNLIANSLKFRSEAAPLVVIRAARRDVDWLISVNDNGLGFDERLAGDLFKIYKKLGVSNSEGAGIGLATCKKVVKLHGGEIWAESTLGVGTTVSFSIPLRPAIGSAQETDH